MLKTTAWMLILLSCSTALAADPPALVNPVGVTIPADATRDQILDALDAVGQNLKSFTAEVSSAEIDALSGDTTTLSGTIKYQKLGPGNARIRVNFDRKSIGERQLKEFKGQEYELADGVLTDRNYQQKLQVRRQVLKPGEKFDPVKLGEGPFPLPIGQKREDVLKMFDAKKMPPKPDDPPGTVHVQLAPKPGTRFARKYQFIDVWAQTKDGFPIRIQTTDRSENSLRVVDLKNLKINPPLTDKDFELEKIQGWTEKEEPLAD